MKRKSRQNQDRLLYKLIPSGITDAELNPAACNEVTRAQPIIAGTHQGFAYGLKQPQREVNINKKSHSSYNNTGGLLSHSELKALNARISANASKWLEDNTPASRVKITHKPKGTRGRKAKVILNPFFGYIGCFTCWGRYPVFALDIIEGVARLDWHDRPIESGGKSMPLSVRNLCVILESLPFVTNHAVEDLLQMGARHARRYVKSMDLIIPRMMKNRPVSLLDEMGSINTEPQTSSLSDCNEPDTPNVEELANLHYDLRTLTKYKTAEEYEAESAYTKHSSHITAFTTRQEHPKKAQVIQLLKDGVIPKDIESETGVSPKTIRKWRADMTAA